MRILFLRRPEKSLFMSCFVFKLSDVNFDGFVIFIRRIIITSTTTVLDNLVFFFCRKITALQDRNFNVIGARMQKPRIRLIFFFSLGFFSQTLTVQWRAGEEKESPLLLSTIPTCSRTFRHLFAALI